LADLRQNNLDENAQPPGTKIASGFNRAAIDGCHCTCQQQRDKWRLFPDECNDDATPVEKAHCLQGGKDPCFDEQAVHQPVLGKEGAEYLANDNEGDEKRPAIEPAQDSDSARVRAKRQVTADGEAKNWDKAFASLKDFTKNATLTPGNAGTLDMLSRGEIAMGPVWVDMFYSWKANGQLPPEMKLVLPAPGMPGQPMHYVIPEKSAHKELAEKFVALATSPKVQAEGIVKRFNWYPGIDADHVKAELDGDTWNKLFTDISPDELAKYGKPFPIAPYNSAILEAYERQVGN